MLTPLRNTRAFTLVESVIATATFILLAGGLFLAFTTTNQSLAMSQQYALGKTTAMDYIAMDLRRSSIDFPKCGLTLSSSGFTTSTSFSLPLVLMQPDYFTSNNRTRVEPTYVSNDVVTNVGGGRGGGRGGGGAQALTQVDYTLPYHYDSTTKTSLPRYVTYSLSGTNLYRKEEAYSWATPPVLTTVSNRLIANGVVNITFSSDEIVVGAVPSSLVVSGLNYQVSFTKSSASKANSTLVGGTANQTILYNRVFLRYATYGPNLPTHP